MSNQSRPTRNDEPHRLVASNLRLAYDETPIIDNLSTSMPNDAFTVILGPNACGKSTLLRALGRLLKPSAGSVVLDGKVIHDRPTKEVARRLGLLPQSPIAPEGIKVADLIGRGRSPHQRIFQQWSKQDEAAVEEAMRVTGTTELANRYLDDLSGGQRQRFWIAMVLAQETDLLLLDEPTTFLDLAHQLDVLELLSDLNHRRGRTIVAVLHDLNLAARYADHIIAMRQGEILHAGSPRDVITPDIVQAVFGIKCVVIEDPETGTPLVVPARPTTHQTLDPNLTEPSHV